jgi:hypothetical protein
MPYSFLLLAALIILVSSGGVACAMDITLAWDANHPSDQVTGYSIHYKTGSSGPPYNGQGGSEGDSPVVVSVAALSDPDNPQYTIHGLNDNETYYLAITASNASGQSGYSSEASIIVGDPGGTPDLQSIEIEGPYNVNENSTAYYDCRAHYTDGSNKLVEANDWYVNCSSALLSSAGQLTTYDVDSDEACQITASYLERGISGTDTHNITIIDSSSDSPPSSDLVVSNVVVRSGENYQVVPYGLQEGESVYIDRSYKFTDVPIYLGGKTYIKTANDDKASTGSNFLSFDVNQDVTVYVAHDDLIKSKPAWLASFTDTGDALVTTDLDKSLSLYAKDFPAGTVTLGGNEGPGDSMYVVVLVGEADSSIPQPPLKATNPTPANGATDRPIDTVLSWSNSAGANGYDVYFGTNPSFDIEEYQGSQISTTFDPGLLGYNTTYYWRIDSTNLEGTTPGDIWSFITGSGDVPGDLQVSNLTVASGRAYEVVDQGLQYGAHAYIDRSYTFIGIPSYVEGATYIKTANDDKASQGNSFLSFDVNPDVTVYVGYDIRIGGTPSWLFDFTDTGDEIVTSDTAFRLFAKDFSAGTITLGGNDGGGGYSMYTVIIVENM